MDTGMKRNVTFWSVACKVLSLKPNYQLTSAEQSSFKKLLKNVPTCHEMCIPSNDAEEPEYLSFNMWMFCQLLHIIIRSEYKSIQESAIDCHCALLDLLKEHNVNIFDSILQCYLKAFEDLVTVLSEFKSKQVVFKEFVWFLSQPVSTLPKTINFNQSPFNLKSTNDVNLLLTFITDNVLLPEINYILSTGFCNKLMSLVFKNNFLGDSDDAKRFFKLADIIVQMSSRSLSVCILVTCALKSTLLKCTENHQIHCFNLLKTLWIQGFDEQMCLETAYFMLELNNKSNTNTLRNDIHNLIAQIQERFRCDLIGSNIRNQKIIMNLNTYCSGFQILENDIVTELEAEFGSDRSNTNLYEYNKIWSKIVDTAFNKLDLELLELVTYTGVNILQRVPSLNLVMLSSEMYNKMYVYILHALKSRPLNENMFRLSQRICCNLAILNPTKEAVLLCALPFFSQSHVLSADLKDIHHMYYIIISTETFKSETLKYLSLLCPYDDEEMATLLLDIFKSVSLLDIIPHVPMIAYNYSQRQGHSLHVSTQTRMVDLFNRLEPLQNDNDQFVLYSKYYSKLLCAVHQDTSYRVRNLETRELEIQCKFCNKDSKQKQLLSSNNILLNPAKSVLHMLDSDNNEVRLNGLKCLPTLYNHCTELVPDVANVVYKLFNDPNEEIKYTFCHYFDKLAFLGFKKYLVEVNPEQYLRNHEKNVLKDMKQTFNSILNQVTDLCYRSLLYSEHSHLQEMLVKTLLIWGLVPLEFTLFPIVKKLLLFISHPYSEYTELATGYLEQIASAHDLKINMLFVRYENMLSEICADHILLSTIHFQSSKDIVESFSFAFGFTKQLFLQDYLSKHLAKHLLPFAVENSRVLDIILTLCECAGCSLNTMLQASFQYVYPHLLLFNKTHLKSVNNFILQETGFNVKNLICQSYSSIIAYILTYYHKNKRTAQEAILVVKQYDMVYKPSFCQTQEGIAEFLSIRFLGILNQLENSLVRSDTPDDIKQNILLSLNYILPLLGPRYITPVRLKVLVTLRTALQIKRGVFPFLVINVWNAFVRSVDSSCLGPMLSTIFVSLLPLLSFYKHQISNLFHYIICTNEMVISSHIQELYFVPYSAEIATIHEIIQKYVNTMENLSLQSRLELLIKYVNHETIEVKLYALERLHKELSSNHAEVRQLMLASDSVHSIVLQILDVLTQGFSERDERIRLKCGECVGELGAVDPSHRPNKIIKSDLIKTTLLDIKSPGFVVQALNILCQGFQAARHSRTIDAFALAIQNTLSIFSVTTQAAVWSQFPEHLQEVMKPLITSRYTMDTNAAEPSLPHPIFGSMRGKTHEQWTFSWITRLIGFVDDETAKNVFYYCKGSMRNDPTTLQFFLPYMLLHAIISSDNNIPMLHEEILAVLNDCCNMYVGEGFYSYRQINAEQIKSVLPISSSSDTIMCMKTIFSLIDYLNKWLRDIAIVKNKPEVLIHQCTSLSVFLNKIDKLNLAKKALQCKEYSRALLFLEQYLKEDNVVPQTLLPTFGEIYAHLNDTDSLRGIVAITEGEPSPQEMILLHEATGQHQDAAACYDKLAQKNGSNPFCQRTVQCYLAINQPFTALQIARGFINNEKCNEKLLSEEAEALLNLMDFDSLENLVDKTDVSNFKNWGIGIGKATLHLRDRNLDLVKRELSELRSVLTDSLFTSSGYREGYDYIVKLHMLGEFEKLATLTVNTISEEGLTNTEIVNKLSDLMVNFDERLKLMQPQGRVMEPVLCLRRVSLTVSQRLYLEKNSFASDTFNQAIGNCWLKSIEIARKASNFQQAYSNILAVDEKFRTKKLFIEKAKLLWDKMEQVRALDTLTKGLDIHFPDLDQVKDGSIEDRQTCAEAKLLIATYNDEMVNVDMDLNLKNYRHAVLVWNRWEKSIVYLAQYQDRLLNAMELTDFYTNHLEFFCQTVMYFGKSLSYGTDFIYQSMPRMISLWLDFGAQLSKDSKNGARAELRINERTETLIKVTRTIENFIVKLPTYMFFTAFSQIVSRICHPHDECFRLIKHIIIKCILEYPNHSLWMFMSLHKSPYQLRMNRFNSVLKDSRLKPAAEFVGKFQRLVEYLSHLCNMPSPKTSSCSLKSLNKALVRLLSEGLFSDIMIPIQQLRTLSLPSCLDQDRSYNPFSQQLVYFQGVEDHVHIFSSLKRPKMITFIGSDGLKYPMICKPKDDLRQDFRLMEFNSIVNMYLKRDPDARDRSLHIRTYSVVPLIDDCGLLEMVPHLTTLRQAITTAYIAIDKVPQLKNIRKFFCDKGEPLEKKKEMFVNHLVPAHPPVLRDWFLREFPSPSLWYLARNAYIRTCAVMSIVGYILGLGDRHGENILLDSMSGDLIHVDFNCLFNKGEQFDIPERVPFRLTHNMVDAMGVGGLEGVFLYSCEITNRVLRVQKEQLLSVLKPFLYDPLVNWQGRGFKGNENAEMTNNEAKVFLENIEGRLQGKVRSGGQNTTIPLSVEGQTKKLIEEATSIENLCQMYHGWAAYQ